MVNTRVSILHRTWATLHRTRAILRTKACRDNTGRAQLEMDLLSMDSTEMSVEITHSGCIQHTNSFVLPSGTHMSKERGSVEMQLLWAKKGN
jgi:hypothetical protein